MKKLSLPAGFTTSAQSGLLNVLKNECHVSSAFDPKTDPFPDQSQVHKFEAIWDTGATNSVITQFVVDQCGLKPVGMTMVHGVSGTSEAEIYLVSVLLPNSVGFNSLRVTKGSLMGAHVLIGMDIINQGDFAVTNHSGTTKFSFQIPSQGHIDFVQDIEKKSKKTRSKNTRRTGRKKSR